MAMSISSMGLALRWTALCAAAEALGIGAAAVWYGGFATLLGEPAPFWPRLGVWGVLALAALPEGFVLGGLQAIGLKWVEPRLSASRWIGATIAVGLVGWAIGAGIPLLVAPDGPNGDGLDPPLAAVALYAAVFGLLVGIVFGAGQAWALPRGTVVSPRAWIAACAAGWSLALPMIYVAAQIASDLPGFWPKLALWSLGGLGAGATIGGATAIPLILARRKRPPDANGQR